MVDSLRVPPKGLPDLENKNIGQPVKFEFQGNKKLVFNVNVSTVCMTTSSPQTILKEWAKVATELALYAKGFHPDHTAAWLD